jgi:DNA-damage-inducible protein J
MYRSERVQARIEPELKAAAEAVFARVGLSPTEAIRLFYKQVELSGGLPFEVRIPNEETVQAIREADERRGLVTYDSLDAFKRSLEPELAPDH